MEPYMPVTVLALYASLIMVPGAVLALALGLRGWLLVAAAPLLTYGLVGAAGSTLPLAGVLWTPMVFLIVTAAGAAVVLVVRVAASRSGRVRSEGAPALTAWGVVPHLGTALCAATAAGVGIAVAATATRDFAAVPQVWDSVFHSNAIRYIADSGESDPAALRNLNDPVTTSYYYPNAFHVVAATVVMITSVPVPMVVDLSVALFPGILAVGMVALVRYGGGRPALAASAALLSCAFTAFPYDLLPWGTLLPFITAVALLPAFLAVLAAMLSWRDGIAIAMPIVLGVGGIGLLALHPSGAVAAALMSIAMLVQRWLAQRPGLGELRSLGLTAIAAVVLGTPLLLASARAASGPPFDWPANLTPANAAGQLFFLSHDQPFPQYWLIGLLVIGLLARRAIRPFLWFVAAGALFAALFVMTAAYENDVVALLTRPWWNDRWRFAALWTLPAILLAASGMVAVRDGMWALLERVSPRVNEGKVGLLLSSTVLAAVLALVAGLSDGLYMSRNTDRLAQGFTDGPTVSTLEEQAYDELAQIVTPGTFVMNDPYDGSAMMWALDDVRPVFASPVIALQELPTMDPERRTLFTSFNQIDVNLGVQRAAADFGIEYVVLGEGLIAPAGDHAPGMLGLEDVRALELVYDNPDARIYRIRWEDLTAVVRG
ncbi:DUF6541 family protein [Pseudonocardia hydrocarbonoxydans]|uniref:DUF6541 family protein n=1 Tax=Pseudonocardia hydrocarbonoxydans TaxID=76726 RepID=UPI001141C1E3|nr:DUF6541 family protein [Pseudonocardia hydrocarbonoxydans]